MMLNLSKSTIDFNDLLSVCTVIWSNFFSGLSRRLLSSHTNFPRWSVWLQKLLLQRYPYEFGRLFLTGNDLQYLKMSFVQTTPSWRRNHALKSGTCPLCPNFHDLVLNVVLHLSTFLHRFRISRLFVVLLLSRAICTVVWAVSSLIGRVAPRPPRPQIFFF